MKILLEQVGQHLEMKVIATMVINEEDRNWGTACADMAVELKDRQGVKRMSYDTWHWDLRRRREAEEYITYFYLKHN